MLKILHEIIVLVCRGGPNDHAHLPGPCIAWFLFRDDDNPDRGQGRPRRTLAQTRQVLPLIVVKPGDRLAGTAVRDGLSTLYLKGIFKDIRVEAFPDARRRAARIYRDADHSRGYDRHPWQ